MVKSIKADTLSGFKVIDTRNWKPGIYSVVTIAKDKELGAVKVIRTK